MHKRFVLDRFPRHVGRRVAAGAALGFWMLVALIIEVALLVVRSGAVV